MMPMLGPALLAALVTFAASPASALTTCRAVDGDTLACGQSRVRLIGLDAPEMRGQCPHERAIALAARRRLQDLVAGGVHLQASRSRDRYHRRLAIAFDSRGRDIASIMIAEGHARPYDGRGRRLGWCNA